MLESNMDNMESVAQDFWEEVEKEAEALKVTVDYYLAEFFTT